MQEARRKQGEDIVSVGVIGDVGVRDFVVRDVIVRDGVVRDVVV